MMSHVGTKLQTPHLPISRSPYSEDKFRVRHKAAIIKIWLTFEDRGWFRVGFFLYYAVWTASSSLTY